MAFAIQLGAINQFTACSPARERKKKRKGTAVARDNQIKEIPLFFIVSERISTLTPRLIVRPRRDILSGYSSDSNIEWRAR